MNEKKSQDINKVKEENIASETREYEKHDSNNIWIKSNRKFLPVRQGLRK